MTTVLRGIDCSYDLLTDAEAQQLRAAGVDVFVQCLWTGAEVPHPLGSNLNIAQANLEVASRHGFLLAGYASLNGARDGGWHVDRARAAVSDAIWRQLHQLFVDIELDNIPNEHVRQAVEHVAALGKPRAIYTSHNAWVNKQGDPRTFTDCGLWNANWSGRDDLGNFERLPFGGWRSGQLIGEQYEEGQPVEGQFADKDVFVRERFVSATTEEEIAMNPAWVTAGTYGLDPTYLVYVTASGQLRRHHVKDATQEQALEAAGIIAKPVTKITQAQLDQYAEG